nr:hypothetical protein [Tanacetum cinerariifolium]
IQRLDDLERKFDVWTKVDHSKAIEALIQANVINEKRCHEDKDEDLTAGSDQGNEKKKPRKDTEPSKKSSTSKEFLKGKTLLKTSKSAKSVTVEEPIEEQVHEMTIDVEENIVDDMVNADEQPDGEATPKTDNSLKNDWFKQPPRPPTPDLMNWYLVGLVYKLLKGTCQSSIELEYNMEECYKALSDQLNWANPKGDRYPYDLSKSFPLKSRLGHLTVAAEYFFNNDLEYLKLANLERKYTMSITKTMASSNDGNPTSANIKQALWQCSMSHTNADVDSVKRRGTSNTFDVRLTKIENIQTIIQIDLALLDTDTAFKGPSFSTPSESAWIQTLAITNATKTVRKLPLNLRGKVNMVTAEAQPEEPKEAKVPKQEPQVIQTVIPTTTSITTEVITPITTIIPTEVTHVSEASGSSPIIQKAGKEKALLNSLALLLQKLQTYLDKKEQFKKAIKEAELSKPEIMKVVAKMDNRELEVHGVDEHNDC